MGRLDGALNISEFSIPGTHDSSSRCWGRIPQTQTWSFLDQLASGLRYFDMRVQLEQGETNDTVRYAMHHGITYQCVHFDDLLHIAKTFLRDHPTEALLFRVKKEGDSKFPPTV